MKTLILAEKPAQARDYADALGGFSRKDGYLESKDAYITWCFGHLVQLEEDTAYRGEGAWNQSYLPLIPGTFQYCIGKDKNKKTDTGKKKQLMLIKELASKSSEIINATDADREGELIFLYVYNFLNLKLPYKRLWISSLTKGDILKGFKKLLSPNEVDNLGKAGYARAISDWLVGINGTQAATLKLGNRNLLTIGRVQTAILKIICERYLKHKNFKSTSFYRLKAEHRQGQAIYFSNTEIFENKIDVLKVLNSLGKYHIFKEKISQDKKVNPPLLYSIDTLIIEANKIFGMSGQETLSIAQTLYEKKLTTYPRTDSNYINEENYESLKGYLSSVANKILGIKYEFGEHKPKSVNAQKLTGSHDAIIPTGEMSAYSSLSEKEKSIYHLIIHKCLESFSTTAIYRKSKYIFLNNGFEFTTNTSVLVEEGWKYFSFQKKNEDDKEADEVDIDLRFIEGQQVDVFKTELVELETQPPKLYTDANLTPDLTNVGKFLKEENPELLEKLRGHIDLNDVQIGTQATRPIIIERLKKLDFIKLEKKKYVPTDKGLKYYDTIKSLEVSNIANTAILEKELKEIAEGKLCDGVFYQNLEKYVRNIVSDIFQIEKAPDLNEKKKITTCPKCKVGSVVEGSKGFGCDQYKHGCDFVIWKSVAGKNLTEKQVKDLIETGITGVIKGFKGKRGDFEAKLKMKKDFKLEFYFG